MKTQRKKKAMEVAIHVAAWCIFMSFPVFFVWNRNDGVFEWSAYLHHCAVPAMMAAVFYLNYFLLVPRLMSEGKIRNFVLMNLVVVLLFTGMMQLWQTMFSPVDAPDPRPLRFRVNPVVFFVLRDFFSCILVVSLSTALRMSGKWRQAEEARKEAEMRNLRNQLNPHFLLNTLNNIYALIAFDSDKAQSAVQELSRLLRYVLYDNQNEFVPLGREVDFIRNYIALMRIRMASNVEVSTDIDVDPLNQAPVAPLLFISLIENAFKHGISPVEQSYIRIHISYSAGKVVCDIRNSSHPKPETDKSGSGIGLEQVARRLDILYPGRYVWKRGEDAGTKEYYSHLEIEV